MPRKPAINCTAVIEFFEFNNDKRRIFQPILGRWSSTKELYPITVDNQYKLQHKIYHPDPVTITTNDKEELAVIIKFKGDREAYGWSNEIYFAELGGWRNLAHKINEGEYIVKVSISTQNDESFTEKFKLTISDTIEGTSLRKLADK